MKVFRDLFFVVFFPLWLFSAKAGWQKKIKILIPLSIISLMLYFATGCYYYRANTVMYPSSRLLEDLIFAKKIFVVHTSNTAYIMTNMAIKNDTISCNYIADYKLPEKAEGFPDKNTANKYNKEKETWLLNEVHLYVRRNFPIVKSANTFSIADIDRCDVYEFDAQRTKESKRVVGVGVGCIAVPAVAAIITALSSCPFIYVNNDEKFALSGEIYSGAISSQLERNDYLTLPELVAKDGRYLLKISNELKENQHTNLTELMVIDHPLNSRVLIDKYGNYQTALDTRAPVNATNFSGIDILPVIHSKDSLIYYGLNPDEGNPLTDGVIMTFYLPGNTKTGKLFIRAKNSMWLDYVYKNFHDLMGGYNEAFLKKQENIDSKKIMEWSLSQKIPLSIFIEKNGKWVFSDYYNMAGPLALKEDVIALDLKDIDSKQLKIKLEYGSYFWEIDYVGIDYSANIPVNIQTVRIDKAINEKGEDIGKLLKYEDSQYYVQEENNIADLSFSAPANSNSERTIILHSKGFYKIVQDSKGLPKVAKLKEISKPGLFMAYSRELMMTELEKQKRTENK